MNALKELEKINNFNFKLLIFIPLISFFCVLFLAESGFDFKIIYTVYLILFILQFILFALDRKFLKEKQAFCPAWEWFILLPVYVYKRQSNNFLSLKYFYISLLFFIFNALISAYVRNL